ncbi:hypothetical protein BEN35_06845 [Streptomyces fradiae]|nr:hypothetical protein BEN35_06845 [Streptomyces fradiae]
MAGTAVCPVRLNGLTCAPLNDVLITAAPAGSTDCTEDGCETAYAACSCGHRFPLTAAARQELGETLSGYRAVRPAGGFDAQALDALLRRTTWPLEQESPLAKRGVVPVGTPVLHRPARRVPVISTGLIGFSRHMMTAMERAQGIGLAANQAGSPVRVLAHDLRKAVPQILVNPELVRSAGTWRYREGCLSLRIEGTLVSLVRPKVISVVASLLDGRAIALRADELLARVLQHELDHLDGIEYVQRLEGETRSEVYGLMEARGIALSQVPPRPYPRDPSSA